MASGKVVDAQTVFHVYVTGNQNNRRKFTDYLLMLSDHPSLKTEWEYCVGHGETYASHENAWLLCNLLPYANKEV